jgi:DNA-binding response OmpR family regulator
VVVVDDDDAMRELIRQILSDTYAVETARDGVEGLALVKRTRPDLVVLDLLMPHMHGFEVCQRIRSDSDAGVKATKILISSSKSYGHDVRTAVQETGADDYIIKPFDLTEFHKRVDTMLGGA